MKLRKLTIQNFRGIRHLEWNIYGDMVCLVGPNDSTKSTILLALEYLFSPNWGISVSVADFYKMNVQNQIEISAVITELSNGLVSEDKFGLFLGFWNKEDGVHEQQRDNQDQKALQIRLIIKSDLEPDWQVVSLQTIEKEPQKISASDRRMLGVSKISNYTDADLSWGRNSALSRLTKEDISKIPDMLAEAERNILKSLESMDFSNLSQSIQDVIPIAQSLGINAQNELCVGIDPVRVSLRQGAIALFDGDLPLSMRGAGSRRLMAMAIHKASVKEGAVILVDEIENSLEPYRLRHLVRQLRPRKGEKHQVIFTSHSSVAIVECDAEELCVVRSKDGETTINHVGKDLQGIVRKVPEAFLTRKVVVCEGKTEAGLLVSLDKLYWEEKHRESISHYQTMAEAGVAPIEAPGGGGSESPKYAIVLAKLGYHVAFFGDSDQIEKLIPSVDEMQQAGIQVFLWSRDGDKGFSIEERLCRDLPLSGLEELVKLAIELEENDHKPGDNVWRKIHDQVASKGYRVERINNLNSLIQKTNEQVVREAIGESAKNKDAAWFKRMDKGNRLGELLARNLDSMQGTPTIKTLSELEKWCYVR